MRIFVVLTFLKRGIFTLVKILSVPFSHAYTEQPQIRVYIFYEPAKKTQKCLTPLCDWLMIWEQNDTELFLLLTNTGTHADLFGKNKR